ncbi:hypothetical protein [Mariprofundus sp. KV]|uniref:hypothetical protein n=1 Tax=Mariprofundus sp. KV TaxID=2608715 RepID=UPI0015A363E0|nr:hypothetical protein [Mariprofundus sp. KV]NWF37380.1 hypothetical protein [Mariprofundus sp. KV]
MGEEFKDEHERAEFLLEVLLNRDETLEFRTSAAVYLGHFDSEKALKSLIEFACNDMEDERLLISCGDAIAEIWDRNHDFDINVVLSQVATPTKDEIKSRLASR